MNHLPCLDPCSPPQHDCTVAEAVLACPQEPHLTGGEPYAVHASCAFIDDTIKLLNRHGPDHCFKLDLAEQQRHLKLPSMEHTPYVPDHTVSKLGRILL